VKSVPTVVKIDPDTPAERMIRVFNQRVNEEGTLNDALKSARYIKESQKRNLKRRDLDYKKRKGIVG
jgi:ribosomal protein S21